jgi:hypothetical protein
MIRTGSVSKKITFEKEQREILNKILNIIGITKEKNTFTLYELSKTPEKIQQILDLKPEIAKFFSASGWNCFKKEDYSTDKEHIVLLRNILKTLDIKYISKGIRIKLDTDSHVNTQKYFILL